MRATAAKRTCMTVVLAGIFAAAAVAGQAPKKAERTDAARPKEPPADPLLTGIDEFKIQLGDEAAAYRRVLSGSLTEIVNPFSIRKRGRVYGSVYEFHRNDNFDARNFFDPVGQRLPEYKRNQFGGSFGTLLSNHLRLFGTYDGLRINKGSTILSHVPTREMKNGDFRSLGEPLEDPLTGKPFLNNRIPAERIHPVATRMLATIPDPNRSDPYRNYLNNLPSVQNVDTFTGRIDYEFGGDSKLFANYSLKNSTEVEVNSLPLFGATTRDRSQSVSLEFTRDFSENLVASLGMKFSREAEQQLSDQSGQRGLLASVGIAGLSIIDDVDEGYPNFNLSGYTEIGGDTDWPTTFFINEYGISPGLTFVHRRHSFEFGAEIAISQINNARTGGTRRGEFEFTGDYTGDAFADFLLGYPAVAQHGVGSDRADLRRTNRVFFARDDWKLNKKLSLSMSLAYNYLPFYRSLHDNAATFAPLLFEPPRNGRIVVTGSREAAAAGLPGLSSGHSVYPDRNDWAPKIGFAFSPLGNNRLVIRGSYQVEYSTPEAETAFDYIGHNYPFFYSERAESPEDNPALDLSFPFQSPAPAELNIRAVEPHFRNSQLQGRQLFVQYEVLRNWNLEIAYAGTKITRATRTHYANVPLPGPGDDLKSRRPNPDYGRFRILSDGGSSADNSLRLDLKKRVSQGFSLQSTYFWSRRFTDATDEPNNPRNLGAEKAPDGQERQFLLNYIFDLPFGRGQRIPLEQAGKLRPMLEGWRVSGITTFMTGSRFTPQFGGDVNNDGLADDRPDRIGPGNLPSSQRSIDRWFATEHFAYPRQEYGFGTCGRNVLLAPGYRNWDISLVKRTRITSTGNLLEFRVHLFNAFNNTNFNTPKSTFGTDVFGKIFGAGRAREIEIALKYSF